MSYCPRHKYEMLLPYAMSFVFDFRRGRLSTSSDTNIFLLRRTRWNRRYKVTCTLPWKILSILANYAIRQIINTFNNEFPKCGISPAI